MDPSTPCLVVGWFLDGAPAPGFGPLTAVVGPAGFLDLMATWLGVAVQRQPESVRIAGCQAMLREGPKSAFWSGSFAQDPWSTAKAVLALRDSWRMAGWDGSAAADAPVRVAQLAGIEGSFHTGEPDLLVAVLEALTTRRVALPHIMLAEPAALWPNAWQRLFAELVRQRVPLCDLPETEPPADSQDLRSLWRSLRENHASEWRGDGSVCLLASENEAEAADVLSAWLRAGPEDVAIIKTCGGLLDPFLRERHLPRLGGDPGPGSGLLALALNLRWDPFDAAAALEFLSLYRTPLGASARFLSRAIEESPGHGGPTFRAGVRDAVCHLIRKLRQDGVDRRERKKRARRLIAEIGFWLPTDRHSRAEGIPAAEVQEVCARLVAWAERRQVPSTGAPAAELAAAVAVLRQDRLSPALLGRMLDSVGRAGAAESRAEAASWRHTTYPGALVSPAKTVVFWLPDLEAPVPAPWRASEKCWMSAQGLKPDNAASRRGRERAALARAVSQACERILLVRPRAVAGEAVLPHPLIGELHACFGDGGERAWTEAGTLRRGGAFAGLTLDTSIRPPAAPPPPLRCWTVPKNAVSRREVESPSGMESLLGCQLAWVLHHRAGLRAQGPATLPDMDRLTGRFLHRVLQILFESRATASDGAAERARAIFERLLPEEAAPLLHPGQETARARALSLLTQAVGYLTRRLTEAGLEVEAVEQILRRPLNGGGKLEGRIDLLLRRPADGLRLVLDTKWTRSNKRHRELLAGDESVQLAAYAWLAEELGHPVTAGYFLLRQARLHTAHPGPIQGASLPDADLPRTWDRALRTYFSRLAAMQSGQIQAAGVPDVTGADPNENDDLLELAPPCGWCDYRPLCGAAARGR